MVASDSSEIVYKFDGNSVKRMLYLQHDQIYLLLWESVITEDQVEVSSRLSCLERNWVFITLILLTLFFFSLMVLNYRFGEYAQSVCDGESCMEYSDDAIEKRAIRVSVGLA